VNYCYIHLAMLSGDEIDFVIEILCTSLFFPVFSLYVRTDI